MPHQLTKRGDRLVFSNGIVVPRRRGDGAGRRCSRPTSHRLIPLYAIGVFTSFTLSQAGMAKRHLRLGSRAGGRPGDQRHSARSPRSSSPS